MKPTSNTKKRREPLQSTPAERFQQTVELSKAACGNDGPMDKTVFRKITIEEKNADHFAFHREFYQRERSK